MGFLAILLVPFSDFPCLVLNAVRSNTITRNCRPRTCEGADDESFPSGDTAAASAYAAMLVVPHACNYLNIIESDGETGS